MQVCGRMQVFVIYASATFILYFDLNTEHCSFIFDVQYCDFVVLEQCLSTSFEWVPLK